MPQNFGQGFRHNNRFQNKPKQTKSVSCEINETNPVLKAFHGYALELNNKHDRYERIVKISRDITIESKRIIFLLHTIDGRMNNKEKILKDAEQRLNKVIDTNFRLIAKELDGQDPYQYRGAFSPGLQEFIEAYTFMQYFQHSDVETELSDWEALGSRMHYEIEIAVDGKEEPSEDDSHTNNKKILDNVPKHENKKKLNFLVDPNEYIAGLSDLTGELMRRCINSLGSGETSVCLDSCKILQNFYTGYMGLSMPRNRELARKIYTMRQSVLKAENVCYNVKVRGGEAAKWGAVFDNKPMDDIDEGFF